MLAEPNAEHDGRAPADPAAGPASDAVPDVSRPGTAHLTGPPAVASDGPQPAPSLPEAAADPDAAVPAFDIDYDVTARWDGGFNAALEITSHDTGRLEPWSVTLDPGEVEITASWGMTVTPLADGRVLLEGADFGAALAPWETVTVGFTGRGAAPEALDISPAPAGAGDRADPAGSAASPFEAGDYAGVLGLSMEFYAAQYSGALPEVHPIDWRGDSALDDGSDVGRDLTGGWYDAGDHVKFGLPMAYTATTLAWGARDFAEGYRQAGATDRVVDHLGWVADYLMRCYDDRGTAALEDDVFYAQVGDPALDHAYWGPPERMTMDRPAYAVTAEAPGTEVTAETAAALAAGAMVLSGAGQGARADEMLVAAEKLFAFSEAFQGSYNDAIPRSDPYYHSWSGYRDELAWGASWLYEATGEQGYLDKAEAYYQPPGTHQPLSWDDKSMGTAVRLAEITGEEAYVADVGRHIGHWMNDIDRLQGTATNDGMGWYAEWGANRYAANTAFVAMQFAEVLETRGSARQADEVRDFAADQIDYMMGDNPDHFSYVVGFGEEYPEQPHHRAASGTEHVGADVPNAHDLNGALVGGPDHDGSYDDVRSDYVANEVALDYNAGFSGALAALVERGLFQ